MNYPSFTPERAPELAESTETGGETASFVDTLDDHLKQLRLRRYQQGSAWLTGAAAPAGTEPEAEPELAATAPKAEAEPEIEAEAEQQAEVEEEAGYDFVAAFEEVAAEVRKLGRELFKSNRVGERNQELFQTAITEVRQLAATVAQIPAQHDETLNETRFQAKAALCRELLRLTDTLNASVDAATAALAQLQRASAPPVSGWRAWLLNVAGVSPTATADALAPLQQWHAGQRLLAERLHAILHAAGVRAIETAERVFDPTQHRAVSVSPRTDLPPNTITGEELKGYTLEGRILRYAEVVVSKHE